ncbi:uncharacterized protein LAJ45_00234 [Morchella importuna]|uniref:uncharacterized protein n=1 Tax=Morchella importuna TaxID=1174673 RepID=UPI001E8CE157|nr:uncharacterized protein LAJ45_00234 [Morchella importuna]KAH8155225.1 hypothetical protein LAJ45_00234 [Morchella importuna]
MAAPPESPFFKPLTGVSTPTVVNGTLTLALTLPFLSDVEQQQYHYIVLLTESEYPLYTTTTATQRKTTALPDTARIYLLEPTPDNEQTGTWSLPVLWPAGNAWRARHGFEPVDFRIPILHKGSEPILHSTQDRNRVVVNGLSLPPTAEIDLLDALFLRARTPTTQLHWAVHLTRTHPTSERGWARLAATAFATDQWKLALLSYQRAHALSTAPKRQAHYETHIAACSAHTEYGPLFTDDEAAHITAALPAALVQTLSAPLPPVRGAPTARALPLLESRTRYSTLHPRHQLPRFFSWLVPHHLCAMSTPRNESDVQVLHDKLGVTHIVTLTAETPLPALWFPPAGGVRNTFVPVENYYAPTVAQMDRVLRVIVEEAYYDADVRGATLVHCGGGKGRAGTVLACYVALFGFTVGGEEGAPPVMAAGAAVEAVRGMRVGSIETEQQERFVASYVSLAWKRHGRGEPLTGNCGEVDELAGVEMEVVGSGEAPDFVVLVGLQGGGKSGFARMCRLRNANVEVLSPDEIVAEERVGTASAKRACEAAVGQWRGGGSGSRSGGRKVLVLDRCNPTPDERREWVKMFNYSANITAVWFDYDVEICQSRAENRGLHPTMPPHRVKSAISSTAKLLQPPTLDEGFTGVVRIRCIANAVELANRWFGEVPMRKFVRTRHLLDLGSATRDDLVLDSSDLEGRFQKMVIVEEKVDGANIGFSLDATGKILVQNRSHYISSSDQAQFSKIDWWLEKYGPKLYRVLARDEVLKERYVLFGEWMAATHSIAYTKLPGFFLAFDLLDRLTGSFVGRDTLVGLLKNSGISIVPEIYRGILEGREMLLGFLERESLFAPGTKVEGVVVRWQNGERGKVVRENFVAGSEHWSKNEYRKNRLAVEEEEEAE